MASYAVIWPIGSLVQQSIQGRKEYDYGRVVRFSFYGCCFVAPTLYTWIKIAGMMFPGASLRHALYKVRFYILMQVNISAQKEIRAS